MKKGYGYTIVFMALLAAVLTLGLATAQSLMNPRIKENQKVFVQRSLLSALNIPFENNNDSVKKTFEEQVKPETRTINGKTVEAFRQVDAQGTTKGYAFPIEGSGLWGTIRGYVATSADLKTIKGITFTDQNETPGLGGRITEAPFLDQWRDIPLSSEPVKYGQNGDKKLDALSGATQTSSAVMRIVNEVKTNILPNWEVK